MPPSWTGQLSKGTSARAVPGVTEDDVDAINWTPLIRRILRDGRNRIDEIRFNAPINVNPGNRLNETGLYWIRIRTGNPSEAGTYTLRVTRN